MGYFLRTALLLLAICSTYGQVWTTTIGVGPPTQNCIVGSRFMDVANGTQWNCNLPNTWSQMPDQGNFRTAYVPTTKYTFPWQSITAGAGLNWPYAVAGFGADFPNLDLSGAGMSAVHLATRSNSPTNASLTTGIATALSRGETFCGVDTCATWGDTYLLTDADRNAKLAGAVSHSARWMMNEYDLHITNASTGAGMNAVGLPEPNKASIITAITHGAGKLVHYGAFQDFTSDYTNCFPLASYAAPCITPDYAFYSGTRAASTVLFGGPLAPGSAQNSQAIELHSTAGGGGDVMYKEFIDSNGTLQHQVPTNGTFGWYVNGVPVSSLSATAFGVAAYAGAAPTANGLLAYDTTQQRLMIGGGTGTAASGSPAKVLSVQTSSTDLIDAAVVNTAETAFATAYTVSANYLGIANKTLRVSYSFVESSSGTPVTARLRIRLGGVGGVTIFDSTAVTPTININNRTMTFVCWISATGAPGASVAVYTACEGPGTVSPATTPYGIANTVTINQNIATNASQALTATMTYGGNTAGNTNNLWRMIVEELN